MSWRACCSGVMGSELTLLKGWWKDLILNPHNVQSW
jgi:hypothetical protein